MTVLICPVRPGDRNEELRFAIRSWETNLVLPDGLELWTVGHKPTWLSPDRHIDGNRQKSMPLAVFDNIFLSAEAAAADGLEGVVYMNDDFFCLDPVGAVVPVRRNATLREQVAHFPENTSLWWPSSLRATLSWLESKGYTDPDSYETHRPLPARPEQMLSALTGWLDDNSGLASPVVQWRTAYGVLNGVDAHPVKDVKLGAKFKGLGTPWVSTSDESWRIYGRTLANRFQKPSRWEVG